MPDPRFTKFVLFIDALVPLAILVWDASWHRLGVNPVEFAIRTTGSLALIFLLLSLSVTPLRKITGLNYFSHFRRMLGLYSFFYACVHFSLYFVFDRSMNFGSALHDFFARRFIFFGLLGLLCLLPMAITSTNKMIKRLGAAKWKRLHRLAYVAACAGVLHYYLLVKADVRLPLAFAGVLALLLGIRVVYSSARRTPPKPAANI